MVVPADPVRRAALPGGRVAQPGLIAQRRPPGPDRPEHLPRPGPRRPVDRPDRPVVAEVGVGAHPVRSGQLIGGREAQHPAALTQLAVPVQDRPAHPVPAGARAAVGLAVAAVVHIHPGHRAAGVGRVEPLPGIHVVLVPGAERDRHRRITVVGVELEQPADISVDPAARTPVIAGGLSRLRPHRVPDRLVVPARGGTGLRRVPHLPGARAARPAVPVPQIQPGVLHPRAGQPTDVQVQPRPGHPRAVVARPQLRRAGLVALIAGVHPGVERRPQRHARIDHHREVHPRVLQELRVRPQVQPHQMPITHIRPGRHRPRRRRTRGMRLRIPRRPRRSHRRPGRRGRRRRRGRRGRRGRRRAGRARRRRHRVHRRSRRHRALISRRRRPRRTHRVLPLSVHLAVPHRRRRHRPQHRHAVPADELHLPVARIPGRRAGQRHTQMQIRLRPPRRPAAHHVEGLEPGAGRLHHQIHPRRDLLIGRPRPLHHRRRQRPLPPHLHPGTARTSHRHHRTVGSRRPRPGQAQPGRMRARAHRPIRSRLQPHIHRGPVRRLPAVTATPHPQRAHPQQRLHPPVRRRPRRGAHRPRRQHLHLPARSVRRRLRRPQIRRHPLRRTIQTRRQLGTRQRIRRRQPRRRPRRARRRRSRRHHRQARGQHRHPRQQPDQPAPAPEPPPSRPSRPTTTSRRATPTTSNQHNAPLTREQRSDSRRHSRRAHRALSPTGRPRAIARKDQ
jgi:hypothetical protein